MNRQEMIEFINSNPVCSLATVSDNIPHVRTIMTFRADDSGIILITGTVKTMHKQMLENPNVEFCYYSSKAGIQLRISGRVEMVDNDSLKQEILDKFFFLKPVAAKEGLEVFKVWRLASGSAHIWNQDKPFAPQPDLQF